MLGGYEYDVTRLLAGVVLLSLVCVVFIGLTASATSESYTEFYVLSPDGEASDYPTSLSVNESGTVLVGVSNAEGGQRTYTVGLRFDGERVTSRTMTVRDGGTWERNLSFTPRSSGTKRLQIHLYDGAGSVDASDPRQQLRLWIEVEATQSRTPTANQSS